MNEYNYMNERTNIRSFVHSTVKQLFYNDLIIIVMLCKGKNKLSENKTIITFRVNDEKLPPRTYMFTIRLTKDVPLVKRTYTNQPFIYCFSFWVVFLYRFCWTEKSFFNMVLQSIFFKWNQRPKGHMKNCNILQQQHIRNK